MELSEKLKKPYLVLAYYHFTPIANPVEEVSLHKAFFQARDVASRIYISEQGINGQMSAAQADAVDYMRWMHSRPLFADVVFKLHEHHENVFPRVTVKYRRNLVATDEIIDLGKSGEHVLPAQWKEMMEDGQEKVLLDVRNDYEWKLGHFEGAEAPPCQTFRDFSTYAKELKERTDPQKARVMMYCTGGIRCELFSAVLKEHGFQHVYQLSGGVVNYGLKVGGKGWRGKLFVFDDRLAVPLTEKEEGEVIGKCHHCGIANDHYHNCANMDCNELFFSCKECLEKYAGCCDEECKQAERVRPYHHCTHKPFRKWYHYADKGVKKSKLK